MSTQKNKKKLERNRVGELPLLQSIVDRLSLKEIIREFIPDQNEEIPVTDVLILMVYSIASGKTPLYEL